MEGYSNEKSTKYYDISEDDDDEEDDDTLKKKKSIKYTILKEEDFIE